MRKSFYVVMALVMALSSCSEEDQFGTSGATFEDFAGEIVDTESRTSMDANGSILWSSGDAISLFKKNGYHQKYTAKTSGSASTGFEYGGESESSQPMTMHYAVYPYSAENSVSGNTLTVDLSSLATQSYTATTFENGKAVMVAKSTTTQLTFTNAFSLANVKLTGEVNNVPGDDIYVTKIMVESATKALSGTATIDMSEDKPVALFNDNVGSKVITLSCKDDNDANSKGVQLGTTPADFYILMPAITFPSGDLTITVYATVSGEAKMREFNLTRTGGFPFLRSKITTLTAEIELDDWNASTEITTEEVSDVSAANDAFEDGKAAVKLADATEAANTAITVPTKSTEAEADVEHLIDLSEATMPTNGPVKIAVEEGNGSADHTVEEVTVVVPDNTPADGLEINAPGTTVTIIGTDGTVIASIVGSTANETLVIGSGVTVTNLTVKKGNVRIEAGGAVTNISLSDDNEAGVAFVTYEGAEAKKVAYVATLSGLKTALADNATTEIILLNDIETSEKISVLSNVVINGNNNTLTYTGTDRAIDVASETNGANLTINDLTVAFTSTYCQRGINYNTSGKLELNNVIVESDIVTYAVNFPSSSNNATVTITDSKLQGLIALNVWGENMDIDVTGTALISVDKNSEENYAAVSLSHNGTVGANGTTVNIEGGSIIATDENSQPSVAVRNSTATGEVNVSSTTKVTGEEKNPVALVLYEGQNEFYSCSTLKEAIEKALEDQTGRASVKVIKDITDADEIISIPTGKSLIIDMNGKTITGTDNTEKNFSVLDNTGTLTIKNSNTEKEGKLTLTATINSGWNRYSAVIANNPGGNLTVESGVVIEHLGGTDMAYGIDNLTNGKGTSAVTTVDGATVKSAYIGIRQFLNGIEATNELYVKSGTIEGVKRSIWLQDPNANANTGKLVVEGNAELYGMVQFSANAQSTEWPVEISVAKIALKNGAEVTTNAPGYQVVLNNGNYVIKKVFVSRVSTLEDLKTALTAAGSAGAGYSTIYIESDINMTGQSWTPISIDGYHGADIVTVEGGNHTITGLTAGLFAGGFAGGSGIVIKDLTIDNSAIIANNTQGYGAFVGCADSMEEITLINCHLKNSSIITPNDGADDSRIGGLIGWTAGYGNENDGPVDSYITVKDCSVEGCTLKGAGSIGGIVGHAGANEATFTTIENCTLTGNNFISTDDGDWRVGVVVGTANNGQCAIKNITESNNTLEQTGKEAPTGEKRNYYGRFVPSGTGTLTIDGTSITE